MDNFGDNFFFDIAIHDTVYYDKYLKGKLTLRDMANDARKAHYWKQLNIPEAVDWYIAREENILKKLEARYADLAKNNGLIAKLKSKSRQDIKKQKEIVIYLHDAKDALNFTAKHWYTTPRARAIGPIFMSNFGTFWPILNLSVINCWHCKKCDTIEHRKSYIFSWHLAQIMLS